MKEYIMADYDGGQKIGDLTVVGELVRCKDCKYWNRNNNRCAIFPCTEYILEDDYCSYAERKHGQNNS